MPDDLDRILSAEEELQPSPGFPHAVMAAVRREASSPPIPFPWRRALPGLAATGAALVATLLVLAQGALGAATARPPPAWLSPLRPALDAAVGAGIHWLALGLVASLASVALSWRFAAWRAA